MEAFVDHRAEAVIRAAIGGTIGTLELAVGRERPSWSARAVRRRMAAPWVALEDVTELRRLQRIRAEFIDNLSHELRTPLTTVRLLTERLAG